MSRSRWALTRTQSVRDVLRVDFPLTLGRLSHRDDVDVVALFRVNDRNDHRAEKPRGHEPLLLIREPIVFVGVRNAIENLLRVDKVEPMLLEVGSPLPLIPGDHLWSVYTSKIYVKEDPRRSLTLAVSGRRASKASPRSTA